MKTKNVKLSTSRRGFQRGLGVSVALCLASVVCTLVGGFTDVSVASDIALGLLILIYVSLLYTTCKAVGYVEHLEDHQLLTDEFIKDRHQEANAINMGGRRDE